MLTSELDYVLPKELIAQHPVSPRDSSRLLLLNRRSGDIQHYIFRDLPQILSPGDCLVVNETRVMPLRLLGTKAEGGARIEVLLLENNGNPWEWIGLAKRAKRLKAGVHVEFGGGFRCRILEDLGCGRFKFHFEGQGDFWQLLEKHGEIPLPPYIDRTGGPSEEDQQRYQTVYAEVPGSSAAPTAGLHFTPELIEQLQEKGILIAKITLHVGPDTFRPIQTDKVEEHPIHSERYIITDHAADLINRTLDAQGRIIAVGTTTVRTLESAASPEGQIISEQGTTRLFIHPGYTFKIVRAMITNFHLPRTTLLALVHTFGGSEHLKKAYEEAIRLRYRFYSYGDAMLIV